MLRAIDLTRAGMLRIQAALETHAYALSNLQTPGFKFSRAILEAGEAQVTGGTLPDGTQVPSLSANVATRRLFTQGPLRETGAELDFAIDGDGFFVMQGPEGTPGYTRNGAFRLDDQRRVVDSGGRALQPGLALPAGATAPRIAEDGTLTVAMPDRSRRAVGQVQVARFVNPGGLVGGTDGVFQATAESGPALVGGPSTDGRGRVRSGVLEDPNTDLSEQMAALTAAQRAYQMNTSAFRMADEMLRMAGTMANG